MPILLSIQKFISLLIMPVGVLWLALIIATCWCWRRQQRGPAIFLLIITVFYAAIGTPFLGKFLLASLERDIPVIDVAMVEPFDAVFVLGGGTSLDPAGHGIFGPSGDRLALAAQLWHAGKVHLLVTSGTTSDTPEGQRDMGQDTRKLWLSLGVPDSAILVVNTPCWITAHEIAAYTKLVEQHTWQRMGLISAAWHLPRALALAERAQLKVIPLGADWRGSPGAFLLQDLVPQALGFTNTQLACWEYLGRWVGR